MEFGEVLTALRAGNQAKRKGWNNKDQYLELQVPDENSKMTEPYIYLNIPTPGMDIVRVPWVASQTDLLANDWQGIVKAPAK